MTQDVIPWGDGQIAIGATAGALGIYDPNGRSRVPDFFWLDRGENKLTILHTVISHDNIWGFWDGEKDKKFHKQCSDAGITLPAPHLKIEDNLAITTYSLEGISQNAISQITGFMEGFIGPYTHAQVENSLKYYPIALERPDFVLGIRLQPGSPRSLKGAMIDKVLHGVGRDIRIPVGEGATREFVNCMITMPDVSDHPPFRQAFPDVMLALLYLMPVVYRPDSGEVGIKKEYLPNTTRDTTLKLQRDTLRPLLQDWARAHMPLEGDDLVVVGDNLAEVVGRLATHPALIEAMRRRQSAHLSARDVTPGSWAALPKPDKSLPRPKRS